MSSLPGKDSETQRPAPYRPMILHHPEAPLFQEDSNPMELLRQAFVEIQGGRFSTANKQVRELLRQASYVNMWFFLRFVAGYSGPYEKLTDHLHMDMCNFYQTHVAWPGDKAAGFLGRFHFKSSIFTHGANGWEILRDPNITIGLASEIIDRAFEFMHITQRLYDSNELFAWLHPRYAVKVRPKGWTDRQMTTVARTRYRTEPTIKVFAVGGSTQGIHVDDLKLDDIVGDTKLNSDQLAGAEMHRTTSWLKSNIRTLVNDWTTSRVFVTGTRYASDDPYEWIMGDCFERWGYWDEVDKYYPLKPDGEWRVYYRMAKEEGRIIFPERITEEGLRKMFETDPQSYFKQMMNHPHAIASSDLNDFRVKEAWFDYDSRKEDWVLILEGGKTWLLRQCDMTFGIDPAAKESGFTAKSSRSAGTLWVHTPDEEHACVDGIVDYVGFTTFLERVFQLHKQYRWRVTLFEMQGPFRVLQDVVRKEESRRGHWLNILPKSATGDKDAGIRLVLQPELSGGRIYATERMRRYLDEELVAFPGGFKKDTLDSAKLALMGALKMEYHSEEELDEMEEDGLLLSSRAYDERSPVTGY